MSDLLGLKVKDRITGFTGIAVTKLTAIYETPRYFVEPPIGEEREIRSGEYFNEKRLEVLEVKTLNEILDNERTW
jgi:hypothetical protein